MRTVIGVMGSGDEGDTALSGLAHDVGAAIAREGWVLLNGGRARGVMDASARGAAEAGGFVIGILPDDDVRDASPSLSVAVLTGLGQARNVINVLSSDVVVALRGGAGTISEIALALKAGKHVVALAFDPGSGFAEWEDAGCLIRTLTVEETIAAVHHVLADHGKGPDA